MPDFSPDSVAFITGAASGIGLATAKQLLNNGVTKIAIIDLTEVLLSDAVTSLTTLSSTAEILSIAANCSIESEVDAAVTKTVEKFGRIDFCVNSAGITGEQGKTDGKSTEEWESVLGVNAKGVWLCERAVIRQFLKQEVRDVSGGLPLKTRGAIVNIGSLTSNVAIANLAPYVMSKHAVLGLCKADAVDYAKDGIRINCIAPGCIKTVMTKQLWEGPAVPIGDAFVARAPMSRWGFPEEVAHAASFLLSDKASFITGSCVNVDGGYCAQ